MSDLNKRFVNGNELNASELNEMVDAVNSKQDKAEYNSENNFISIKVGDKTFAISGVSEVVKPVTPTIKADGLNTDASRTITITCATSGVTIYYTTNGDTPTTSSTRYNSSSKPTVSASASNPSTITTIKAIAVKNGKSSDVSSLDVTTSRHVAIPTIGKSEDEYSTSRTITLACGTSGATLYYTTDGSTPSTSSTKYEIPFGISSTKTISVIAVLDGWQNERASEQITVGTLMMYLGLVDTAPTTKAQVEAIRLNSTTTGIKQKTLPYTQSESFVSKEQKKVCFAYNKSLGNLTSIKDANGTEYFSNFTKTIVDNYNVYTLNASANQSGMSYVFKK